MKRLAVFLLIFTLAGLFVTQTKVLGISQTATPTPISQKAANELSSIVTKAQEMVSSRVSDLQKLISDIKNEPFLTSEQKKGLTTDVSSTMTNLNTLQTQIASDTDVPSAQADTLTIVTHFHIYKTYLPKQNYLIAINNLQSASATVSSLSGELQTMLSSLASSGYPVAPAQSALIDMNNQLTNINNLLAANETMLTFLTLTNPNPNSVFYPVKENFVYIKTDFARIRLDIANMRNTLHSLKLTPTPSPTK